LINSSADFRICDD